MYERECLAIVWAVDKFKIYLFGKPFILQTDHRALVFLNLANHTNDIPGIPDIPGKDNVGADYLSRL